MRNLITIILFFIIATNSFSQERLSIDYSVIKDTLTKDSLLYPRALVRYERNDTTLRLQDYALLYYGHSFMSAYKGSVDNRKDNFTKLINNQKYEDAYKLGKEILTENPVTLYALYNMYYICQAMNRPANEAMSYITKYAKLLQTIASSGDGKSEETAFKVISVNDEYQLMYNYWGVEDIKSQSLVNYCDVFEFGSSRHFKGNTMYFDISRSLLHMESIFK